jgi:hypothetical protein
MRKLVTYSTIFYLLFGVLALASDTDSYSYAKNQTITQVMDDDSLDTSNHIINHLSDITSKSFDYTLIATVFHTKRVLLTPSRIKNFITCSIWQPPKF